jgi:hypothetical protein
MLCWTTIDISKTLAATSNPGLCEFCDTGIVRLSRAASSRGFGCADYGFVRLDIQRLHGRLRDFGEYRA